MKFQTLAAAALPAAVMATDEKATAVLTNEMTSRHIIDGEPAEVGRYPWMVTTRHPSFGHYCGGNLIAPNLVLTAAHCNDGLTDVYVGCYSQSGLDDEVAAGDCETFGIVQAIEHPSYASSENGFDHDAMILVLDGESTQTPVALSAPSADFFTPDFTPVTVAGWGTTEDGSSPDPLMEVEVETHEQYWCNEQYKRLIADFNNIPYPEMFDAVDDTMFCASRPGKDSCQGDSGGPVILKCDLAEDADILMGLVSWGYGCAEEGFPGVYTRISNPEVFDFISTTAASFGATLNVVDSYDEFCLVGGTQAPTDATAPPTSYPTIAIPETPPPVPDSWTCPESWYGADSWCDCECGAPDPTCEEDPAAPVFGCDDGVACVNGSCDVGGTTPAPTPATTDAPTSFPTTASPTLSPTKFPTTAAPTATNPPVGLPPSDGTSDYTIVLLAVAIVLLVIAAALLCIVIKTKVSLSNNRVSAEKKETSV